MWSACLCVCVFLVHFFILFGKNVEFNARSYFRTTFNDVKLTLNIIRNSLFLRYWVARQQYVYINPMYGCVYQPKQLSKKKLRQMKLQQQHQQQEQQQAGKQPMEIRQAGSRNSNCTTKYYLNRCIV